MIEGNNPAFPIEFEGKHDYGTFKIVRLGITKREYFIGKAIQGYTAAGSTGMPTPEEIAVLAIKLADTVIAELNKPQSK